MSSSVTAVSKTMISRIYLCLARTGISCSLLPTRILVFLLFLAIVFLIMCLYHLNHLIKNPWPGFSSHKHSTLYRSVYPRKTADQISYYSYINDFHPINDRGVYSFRNVCIEDLPGPPKVAVRKLFDRDVSYSETKRIVVYDSFFRSGQQILHTSASGNALETRWDIFFSHDSIPANHEWNTDTVFFISQSCPGNFHHFWNDEYIQLLSVVNVTNRLQSHAKNRLIYRTPWDLLSEESNCDNVTYFQDFLQYINIVGHHDVFWKMPSNICFQNGVFGLVNLNFDSKNVVKYVMEKAGISRGTCDNSSKITLIQRKNRRILNIHELQEAAKSIGYPTVDIINLEEMSIVAQIEALVCTNILVGVQGAGLQWAVFMKENSTLVEIAWPDKFWGFYFNSWVTPYGIHQVPLIARYVHVNWSAYEKNVKNGNKTSNSEREELLKSKPGSVTVNNIWKWADVVVDHQDFLGVLQTITR